MSLAVCGVEHTSPLVTASKFSPVAGITVLILNQLDKGIARVNAELEKFVDEARKQEEVQRRELPPFKNGPYTLQIAFVKEEGALPQIEIKVLKSGSKFTPDELNTIGCYYFSIFCSKGQITSPADGCFQLKEDVPTATIEVPTDIKFECPRLNILGTIEYHI